MAYVLSLPSPGTLERPFTDSVYMRSCSSFASHGSSGTARHNFPRSISATSIKSISSVPNSSSRKNDENASPRLACRSLLNLIHDLNDTGQPRRASSHIIRKTSWRSIDLLHKNERNDIPPSTKDFSQKAEDHNYIGPTLLPLSTAGKAKYDRMETPARIVVRAPSAEQIMDNEDISDEDDGGDDVDQGSPEKSLDALPFKRWLSTLRKRNRQRRNEFKPVLQVTVAGEAHTEQVLSSPPQLGTRRSGHRKSLSWTSSLGLVTAIKSTSMTLASVSVTARSRTGTRLARLRAENRSSGFSDVRMSLDSTAPSLEPVIDEKAWVRSVQRRKIVEELLESEESYIADMKALVNVYFTLLVSVPAMTPQWRKSIQKSVTQIVQLHEELLAELHKVVPNVESAQEDAIPRHHIRRSRHLRWHSAESAPLRPNLAVIGRRFRHSTDASRPNLLQSGGLVVNTNTVLNVAKTFDKFMRRFLAYEAYVAHNEIMDRDASTASRLIPSWPIYERGVEALAASTSSVTHREAHSRKGLTFSDLLIKPIQRICKYPLFFSDLCKHTPACDDPVAHAELQKVLSRLHEITEEINDARDNPRIRQLIDTTWILQDRLAFQDQGNLSKAVIVRLLGHVLLCGALHIAYSTNDRVKGHYMICVLYRSSLVLASASKAFTSYNVVAIVPLLNATLEASDSGRGLQCHTAPYTWKLVFESHQRQHEVILSACSEREEEEWKYHLRSRIAAEAREFFEGRGNNANPLSSLPLEIKSLGLAFEAHSGFTRRMSIHRAATLGPKTNLHQVIIKNTHAQRSGNNDSDSSLPVMRSQSHMSSSHIPTLAPRRTERIRLEAALADVWSRDVLPYPGMASRRMDNQIRASANSVMRKLSMASIASNFSKRSTSFANFNHRVDEPRFSNQRSFHSAATKSKRVLEKRRSRGHLPLVDFHNAPSAFLPEDFELRKPHLDGKSRRLANRAGSSDRPVTPRPMTPIRMFLENSQELQGIARALTSIETPAPTQSPGSEPSSGRSEATVVHTSRKEETSPPADGHILVKGPTKARSLLFKLLGVAKEQIG